MAYIRKTVDLSISDHLRHVLEQIRSSSIVAEMLLKRNAREDLVDEYVDYLSVSDTDDTKISYLTKDRIEKAAPGVDIWTSSKRFHARPGSIINKIFKNISGKDIEIFNNNYKSALTKADFQLKVISGNEIKNYYSYYSYKVTSGSLGNSCMKYDQCQNFFGLYTSNKDIISMLIMLDNEGRLLGRALLWNFDSYSVMDRIYTISDEEYAYHFKKWANDNGYMYKHEQKWNNTLYFDLKGKKTLQKFSVKLNNTIFDRYPYLDTFKFFDTNTGIFYNYIPEHIDTRTNRNSLKTVCAPDGSYFNSDYLAMDYTTNLFHHKGETVPISYNENGFIPNQYDYLRIYEPNAQYSTLNDFYIAKKDCYYSDEVDDYIFIQELDHLNNKEKINKVIKQRKEEQERRKKEQEMMSLRSKKNAEERSRIYEQMFSIQDETLLTTRSRRIPRYVADRIERPTSVESNQADIDRVTRHSHPSLRSRYYNNESDDHGVYRDLDGRVVQSPVIDPEQIVNQTVQQTSDMNDQTGNYWVPRMWVANDITFGILDSTQNQISSVTETVPNPESIDSSGAIYENVPGEITEELATEADAVISNSINNYRTVLSSVYNSTGIPPSVWSVTT